MTTPAPDAGTAMRPRRSADVETHRRDEDGRRSAILKHRTLRAYHRVAGLSLFLWERLDGERSVADLGRLVAQAGGPRDEAVVRAALDGLARRGFVVTHDGAAPQTAARPAAHAGGWRRITARAFAVLTWRRAWTGADAAFGLLYARGAHVLFRPASLGILGVAGVCGLAAFAWLICHGWPGTARAVRPGPSAFAALVGAVWAARALHECGHALTVRHCGREVHGAGWGWYWLGPVLFVDTSDMWLASRRARIAVSLAGPCVDVLLGGLAAAACLVLPAAVAPYAFLFAWNRYLAAVFNLCPLMQGDGYYVLADALRADNLRSRSLAWLLDALPRRGRRRAAIRGHVTECLYGVGSLVYLAALAACSVLAWQSVLAHWLQRAVAPGAVTAIGWLVALLASAFVGAGVAGELARHARSRRPHST